MRLAAAAALRSPPPAPLPDPPFMSTMDEITYWIYTKRAPCLFKIDSLTEKDGADGPFPKPKSVFSAVDDVPSPRKKRKLSLLNDESVSTERHQNVYFEDSGVKHRRDLKVGSESTLGSDIDFNVKKSSIRERRKRKLQRSKGTTLHKKNKVVTSTPKPNANLRRSLRKANCLNNNNRLNNTFDIPYDSECNNHSYVDKKRTDKVKKTVVLTGCDQTQPIKDLNEKVTKEIVANDQYEDLSDVSGFTANYIRSTKIHSSKTPRKLKCKINRNIGRVPHRTPAKGEERMIVCVNKLVNTGLENSLHNCSTSSSQNVVNLVTSKSNAHSNKVHKSTSLLKFMETNTSHTNNNVANDVLDTSKDTINAELSVPQTSRYPKRHKNTPKNTPMKWIAEKTSSSKATLDRRRKITKNSSQFNNSDLKENPEEKTISRTRSGRGLGLALRQPDNSVLIFNDSTELESSRATINVAGQQCDRGKKKRVSARQLELAKKSSYNCHTSRRESLRDRSGFAACFSDSDDSEPLKQKKFFC